jgi:hypothetical protein
MGIVTKSLSATVDKWGKNTSTAGPYYTSGVESPKRPCIESAKAAEPLYVQGVQDGISRGAFGKGLAKVSESDWKEAAVSKGASRYPAGCRAAAPKFTKAMGPVLSHMQGITLPPPGTRGSPANIQRAVTFMEEMAKFRTG